VIFSNVLGLQLVDMHSTNGTFVNGQRINRRRLRNNDVIAIGSHRLKYVNELERYSEDEGGPGRDTAVLPASPAKPVRRVK
jgi:pSer/pThr/pTyr-binding forkhead associated (FHA) protein